MKRVLFVAYYFPPLGGIGSLRAARFATDLADYGWEAVALAPRNAAYFRDPGLAFPEHRVIRTSSLELSRAGKHLFATGGDDVTPARADGARALIRKLARRYIYFPDAQVGWYLPAVLAARCHVRAGDFDAVFSTSFPVTAHLIARRIHRRLGIPWVAEFRDPWSPRLSHFSGARQRAERLERTIAREASALVTVSPSWSKMLGSAWQREIAVIPNGHDGAREIPAPEPPGAPFILGYLGTYYPDTQDLGAVWEAITVLDQRGQEKVDEIRFIGGLTPAIIEALKAYGLDERLFCTGFLPQEEAVAQLSRCTALLVAGPAATERQGEGLLEKGVIAAKIFEYLASGKPIIYVGDPSADAAEVLADAVATYVVRTGDAGAARAALQAARAATVERRVDAYARHALAGRLAAVLDDAMAASQRAI